jgi:hypothetical protein
MEPGFTWVQSLVEETRLPKTKREKKGCGAAGGFSSPEIAVFELDMGVVSLVARRCI